MEIHWAKFPHLRDATKDRIEARLRQLAEGHNDLIDIRIVAELSDHHQPGGNQVKITCNSRGHQITAARERDDLGRALNEVLDDFEHEVIKLRDRTRDSRTHAADAMPERESSELET